MNTAIDSKQTDLMTSSPTNTCALKRSVVLFDLDGTIVDSYTAIFESMDYATFSVLGKHFPEKYLLSMVGQPLVDQMILFTDDPQEQKQIVEIYRKHNETNLNEKARPFAGVKEMLESLRQEGFLVGLVTSKRVDLAESSLEYHGLRHLFSCIIGAESSTRHKPEPEPLFVGAKTLGCSIDECMYVGDSPYDLQAAQAAGIPSLAVSWGKFFSAEVLQKENPTCISSTYDELLEAIKNLALKD